MLALLVFNVSCSQSKQISISEKEKLNSYTLSVLEYLDGFDGDVNMDDFYLKYKKKDTTFILSSYVPSIKYGKLIRYFKSYYHENNMQNKSNYLFNNNDLISLVINNSYNLQSGNKKNLISDTIYFKNNKLYFWKNKKPSKQEILAKEKEILAIKREIDSVLSE